MKWQDDWATVYQTDCEWLRIKKDGSEPTLEVAEEVGTYEDAEGCEQKKFQLYRFDIVDGSNPDCTKKEQVACAPSNFAH
jgi:hypothetical protein